MAERLVALDSSVEDGITKYRFRFLPVYIPGRVKIWKILLEHLSVPSRQWSHERLAFVALVGIVALSAAFGVSISYATGGHQSCPTAITTISSPATTFTRTVNARTVATVTASSPTYTRTFYAITTTTSAFTRTVYPVTTTTSTFTRTVYCRSIAATHFTVTVHPITVTTVTAGTFTFTRTAYPIVTTTATSPSFTRTVYYISTITATSPTFTRTVHSVTTTTVTRTNH